MNVHVTNFASMFTTRRYRLLLGLILGFGALLRLRDYLANRSLWLDEAWLALNVLGKSIADLILRPLDFNQAAPPGFLLLVKLVVLAFGNSEYVLRLVPLLASVASLLLLAWIAVRVLTPGAALAAMALFVLLRPLIQYAAELKQYGMDVTVGLATIAAVLPLLNGEAKPRHAVVLCLVGAAASWFSHPAPFFLAAAGGVLLVQWRLTGRPTPGVILAIGAVWALSFAVVYVVSLRDLAAHPGLREAWAGTFPPSLVRFSTLPWLGQRIRDLFAYVFDRQAEVIGAILVLAGGVSLLASRPVVVLLLTAPIGVALAAALLGRYPFQGRLVLFALPLLTLLAGAGVEYVRGSLRATRALMVLLVALLLLSAGYRSLSNLIRPKGREELRPVLAYLQRRHLPDDVVYLYAPARPAYEYYALRMNFRHQQLVIGRDVREDWQDVAADLEQLRGRGRVWVLLSHVRSEDERFIQYYLDTLGARRDTFRAPGAAALLYDMR